MLAYRALNDQVEILCQIGFNVNHEDSHEMIALLSAAQLGHLGTGDIAEGLRIAKTLPRIVGLPLRGLSNRSHICCEHISLDDDEDADRIIGLCELSNEIQ